jgi:hypothetical protein
MQRICLTALLALLASTPLAAQNAAPRTPEQIRQSWEAHHADFDYLLGDWEFTARNLDYGEIHGRWSAMKLADGVILDEYRVVGDSNETYYVTQTIRSYNAQLDRWELIGMEEGSGLQDFGTGRRTGGEVHIEQRFGVGRGEVSTLRIRYHEIGTDRFLWEADRSADGGRTWMKGWQQLEARRVGPPRTIGRLTQ